MMNSVLLTELTNTIGPMATYLISATAIVGFIFWVMKKMLDLWKEPIKSDEVYNNVKRMTMMNIQIVNKGICDLPQYETEGSAGMDLGANIKEPITLKPFERKLIPTGLHIALPNGYEAQIRARSGLAIKHGISLVNGIGTIDSDYRGDIGVILVNLSDEDFTIEPKDRVAQMVITKYEQVEFEVVDELDKTDRGEGGFGHTGK